MRGFAVAVLACVGGCALAPDLPPLTCPGKGGSPWTALTSQHLLLRTNLPLADARELILEGERSYDAIEQVLRSDLMAAAAPVNRVHVTVFRHHQDLAALHPSYGGIFYHGPNTPEHTPTLITAGALDSLGRLSLRHELTHRLVAHYLPTAPSWLNEGLAELLSTVKVSGDKAIIGSWDSDLYHHGSQPNVRELFAADSRTFLENGGYYTEASALVHLLQSERRPHRAAFKAYLRRIASGMRADLAWHESFPSLDLDTLERELNGYRFITLRVDTREVAVRPQNLPEPRIRAMLDVDVHLLWVELRSWSLRSNHHEIEKDLEQARQTKHVSAETHYWTSLFQLARNRPDLARDEIEQAVAEVPDDPRYLLVLLRRHQEPAIEERFWKLAQTPSQLLYAAARSYVLRRYEASAGFARAAAAIDPRRDEPWLFLAFACAHLGLHEEGAYAAQRASWAAPQNLTYEISLAAFIRRARAAGVTLPSPPFGKLVPAPRLRPGGLVVRGRIVSAATGAPVANAYVHMVHARDDAATFTDGDGAFVLNLYPGQAELGVVFEDGKLLSDEWRVVLRPTPKPVDIGTRKVVEGQLPDLQVAFDGIDPVSIDGRALVNHVSEGSPAALAGVKAHDAILEVNGHDVRGLGSNAINFYLAGEPGAETQVVIARGTEPPQTVNFKLAPSAAAPE